MAIAAAENEPVERVVDALEQLVAKSLVSTRPEGASRAIDCSTPRAPMRFRSSSRPAKHKRLRAGMPDTFSARWKPA